MIVVFIFTWNAFSLYGPGYDCDWLMAGLIQNLTELLHTVAIHNHGMPAERNTDIFFEVFLPLRPDFLLLTFKVVLKVPQIFDVQVDLNLDIYFFL